MVFTSYSYLKSFKAVAFDFVFAFACCLPLSLSLSLLLALGLMSAQARANEVGSVILPQEKPADLELRQTEAATTAASSELSQLRAAVMTMKPQHDMLTMLDDVAAMRILAENLHDDWQTYLRYRDLKVFVVAGNSQAALPGVASASVANKDISTALSDAFDSCELAITARNAYFSAQSENWRLEVARNQDSCQLFAVGDLVLVDQDPLVQGQLLAIIQNSSENFETGRGKNGALQY